MTGNSPILSDEETAALQAEYVRLSLYGSDEDLGRMEEISRTLEASEAAKEPAALDEFRARMAALRAGREAADIPPGYERAVVHLDGDLYNNDLRNLRVVDLRENQ